MSVSASSVMDTARNVYLNDAGQKFWRNPRLFPFLQEAHRKMQVQLDLNGIPVLRSKSSVITVPALSTNLGANQPTDLVEPIKLLEHGIGEPDSNFTNMIEKAWEPEYTMRTELVYWVWRKEQIMFMGATADRVVIIHYNSGLTIPVYENDSIGFIRGELYLAPMLSALALSSIGNVGKKQELIQDAELNFRMLLGVNVKNQQGLPARRKPYRISQKLYKRIFY